MPHGKADRNRKPIPRSYAEYFESLLQTPLFQSSPRRNELLRYLVHKSLSGHGQTLSEYAIALRSFASPILSTSESTPPYDLKSAGFANSYRAITRGQEPQTRGVLSSLPRVRSQIMQVEVASADKETAPVPWLVHARTVAVISAVAAAVVLAFVAAHGA